MMAVGEESVRPVVIVVDDDDDTCDILSGFLQNEFRVLTARSAEECLQILKRETADLVLLDANNLLVRDLSCWSGASRWILHRCD